MGWKQARADYRRMAKPRAVEEVGDIYLIRPLGFLIVQALRRTPVTPTQVSVLAVLAGWLSAWFYFESTRRGTVAALAVLGALALLLHSALDSADGQLARLKSMQTPLGRIVDGFCDNLSFLAIYLAIVCGGWERAGTHAPLLLALAAAAGASHSVQSSLVEYQRTLYLHYVHGKTDVVDAQPERLRHSAPSGAGAALLQAFHRAYYHQQRFFLSSSAALERAITHWRHSHPRLAGGLAPRYEAGQRPLLPWWALMASNSHKAGIVVAAFLPVGAGSFWAGLGMGWYLVYVLLLDLALLALIPAQRRRDRRLAAELETLAASGAGA